MDTKSTDYNVQHTESAFSTPPSHTSETQNVRAAVQLAEDVSTTRYSPWTRSMWRLYGCLMIAYLCGCLNGYDGSLMGGLNAMPTYLDYFQM